MRLIPLYSQPFQKEIKMKKYIKILFIPFLFLTGCAKSILDNDDVRCPFVDKGGCQSMEAVNQMVVAHRYTPDGQFVQDVHYVKQPYDEK